MTEDLLIDRLSEIPSGFLRLSYRNLCPQTVSENYNWKITRLLLYIFRASIMVAYIRRDRVGLSLFLRDNVY